ncbi:DUF2953 domain-containing protein [Sporohalobacter salinus]|uniref:DUF2953 domain-containing protein n=1 Tax=Sporohalobacter salinus TaxID=1494606 RepID=UPI0019614F23|nr:DUF2953 domain-containing protein [Sporohalobacter salinus]MBM7623557.1 hypothetical protein [Sporohalobacter salinus]
MSWIIFLILLLTVIFLVGYFLPINTVIKYKRSNSSDNLKIWVEIWPGIVTYRLHIPYLELKGLFAESLFEFKAEIEAMGSPNIEFERNKSIKDLNWEEFIEQLGFIKGMTDQFEALERGLDTFKDELHRLNELTLRNPILLRIMGTLFLGIEGKCKRLNWKTEFGIKNPAATGVATGLLWAIKNNLYAFLALKAEEVTEPNFKVIPNFNQVNELEVEFESIFSIHLGKIISRGLKIIWTRYKRRLFEKWQTIQLNQ